MTEPVLDIDQGTRTDTITDEVLKAILRGAAKLLGCTSASLVQVDEEARLLRLRVGTMATSYPALAEVESLMGSTQSWEVPFENAKDSLVFAAWRDREVRETSRIAELARGAFPQDVLEAVDSIIGEHRFIFVPVLGGRRVRGVIVFEKPGLRPFSLQQRELLVQYAQRLGEILGRTAAAEADGTGVGGARFLVDLSGAVAGTDEAARNLPEPLVRSLAGRAAGVLARGEGPICFCEPAPDGTASPAAEVVPLLVRGEPMALVTTDASGRSDRPGDRLVRIALGHHQAALTVDPDLRVTSCSPEAERLFGAGPGELVDQPVGDLFVEPRDVLGILNRQVLFVSHGHVEERSALRRRDGTTFDGSIEAVLLADDADRAVGFLVQIRENTALEGAEAVREVDRLMRQERLATMGEMAAQLAHEIRNPLLAIGATIQALARDPGGDGETRDLLQTVGGEVTRLDMLLRDYLSMAARHNASMVRVDLAELASEILAVLLHSPRAGGRTVRSEVPVGLAVRADPDGLRHVLFNLLSNALEATPVGGLVTVRGAAADSDVVLSVEDTGPGLSVDPVRCFEAFFTTKKNGTGLGLSVVRKVVEAHGGQVDLSNRLEGGCRAVVTLPRRILS